LFSAIAGVTAARADSWCNHSADRSASVDATGATRIVISAGAGDLDVRGEKGQTAVHASGRACASSEESLGQIAIASRRDGDTVYINTILPPIQQGMFGFWRHATLDLQVTLPSSIPLELDDSSGDLALRSVQAAVVTDSSGDMEIDSVAGELTLTDSSGDVTVRNVGAVRVSDSSGNIELADIQGNVEVAIDSSGDLRIDRVGSVHILNDSSGDIVITQIQGDVRIDVDSSGDINVTNVRGDFSVGADSSGSIHQSSVLGAVRLPAKWNP
jgi:Putative adhesin